MVRQPIESNRSTVLIEVSRISILICWVLPTGVLTPRIIAGGVSQIVRVRHALFEAARCVLRSAAVTYVPCLVERDLPAALPFRPRYNAGIRISGT